MFNEELYYLLPTTTGEYCRDGKYCALGAWIRSQEVVCFDYSNNMHMRKLSIIPDVKNNYQFVVYPRELLRLRASERTKFTQVVTRINDGKYIDRKGNQLPPQPHKARLLLHKVAIKYGIIPKSDVLEKETRYDKSGKFDPKTMPIADYHKTFRCSKCGDVKTEVGYVIDGADCSYGGTFSAGLCEFP